MSHSPASAPSDTLARNGAHTDRRAALYDVHRVAQAAGLPPACVEVVGTIGSTSTALLERSFAARPQPPRALVAIEQTAGRGRRGRGWIARPDCSMMLSVAIERAVDDACAYQALPLALGAAIADALAAHGCALRLKWPNDLQRDARKVGGLLVEMRRCDAVERVVVGLGLNLLPDAQRDAAIDQPAAALFDAPGALMPDRSSLAGGLIGVIVQTCARNAAEGFAPHRARWCARDALAGQRVRILEAGGASWDGEAAGIDDDGALRVRTAHGERRVVAGDVSVRAA